MHSPRFVRILSWLALAATASPAAAQTSTRVQLRLDTAEAHEALSILAARRSNRPVAHADWQRLFSTPGYRRLKAREAAMRRTFTDSAFAAFVTSDSLAKRASDLRRTLDRWSSADLQDAARRALSYLPERARIRATIYVVIKPRTNSFVWDVQSDPAIFLYLDPSVASAQFANTVAHELHHIGFASLGTDQDSAAAKLDERSRRVAMWVGAFGEGFAVLAAAGGTDVHPHAASDDSVRSRWDRDVARFNEHVDTLAAFFSDVASGRLATADTVQTVASRFYGTQGPWYTVGWKMAVTIERQFGKAELLRCMTDPHRLLERYNAAARTYNLTAKPGLALWPESVVRSLAAR
jgi:hypothetical protein